MDYLPEFKRDARTLYDEIGTLLDNTFWDRIRDNAQLTPFPTWMPGFTVGQADVRTYPTHTMAFRTPEDVEFNQFQETALHTFEPVLCLGTSADRMWQYVVSCTYSGWVQSERIAHASPTQFEQYVQSQDLWLVTDTGVTTQPDSFHLSVSRQPVEFAAALPVPSPYAAPIGDVAAVWPDRDATGAFSPHQVLIRKTPHIRRGYLPFSRESVVEIAFQLLGERYGWGSRCGLHDCSSLVMDVYRLLGVQLPRNTGDQERALPSTRMVPEAASVADRVQVLATLSAGDLLFMRGHVMMYLGKVGHQHYVIHDFSGYHTMVDGQRVRVPVHQVMVSPLELGADSEKTYLESITGVLDVFATAQE
jgi:cell wall-associated NlpC family hydrolase